MTEEQLKQQAERAYRNRPVAECGETLQAQTTGCIGRAVRVPLREQLEKRGAGIADQHGRIANALDILNRHPEFEEFLQLQELINSGLYY